MGTSDTMFGILSEPQPSAEEGHIFVNPIDPQSYMAMICYKNGSLMREEIRDRSAGGDWTTFGACLEKTEPGNGGNIGFFYRDAEITPPVMKPGIFCFDSNGCEVRKFAPEQEVRAVVEGQFLSMRLHAANVGIRPKRILATGGGSANEAILKVVSQVFGVPVYVGDATSSAAFGAAYRALHGFECEKRGNFVSFAEVMSGALEFRKAVDAGKCPVYEDMITRYAALEKRVIEKTR
jgi:xylulokinase